MMAHLPVSNWSWWYIFDPPTIQPSWSFSPLHVLLCGVEGDIPPGGQALTWLGPLQQAEKKGQGGEGGGGPKCLCGIICSQIPMSPSCCIS